MAQLLSSSPTPSPFPPSSCRCGRRTLTGRRTHRRARCHTQVCGPGQWHPQPSEGRTTTPAYLGGAGRVAGSPPGAPGGSALPCSATASDGILERGLMLTSWLGGSTLWASRAPSQADSAVPLPGPTAQSLGSQQIGGQQLGVQIRQESAPWRGEETLFQEPLSSLPCFPRGQGSSGRAREPGRGQKPSPELSSPPPVHPHLSRVMPQEKLLGKVSPDAHTQCSRSALSVTPSCVVNP